MKERIRLFFKYTILRYRASKAMSAEWTKEEIELLAFVKCNIRACSSIEISEGGLLTKIKNGDVEFTIQSSRLIVIDPKSYLDVNLGSLVQREINLYVNKVLQYRTFVFNKKCKAQIKKLINGF